MAFEIISPPCVPIVFKLSEKLREAIGYAQHNQTPPDHLREGAADLIYELASEIRKQLRLPDLADY